MALPQLQQVDQLKTFLTTYNKLAETCFLDCIHDFTSRTTSSAENTCAINCTEKFLKMAQRIGIRFQEVQELNISGGAK
ncbi:mitochondrial import inner membrane translocase subunit Tim9 isoform X1 [Hydra vulgaris]|uniref:Mitochondrial import inner membrane translocase subunit n=1 Tax=Hydra vulgaris TaxID=6087 RepID=A0ABM4CGF2_HYDVU|nr:mitochondrial import inner membrane translocase subunit Tim9-like [Hydra vulgaris]XP_047132123.1 mitochondrial import inner membrane translocase subunit Tim9-like [Hydra vulgaris]